MKTPTMWIKTILDSTPAEVKEMLQSTLVTEVGFGAGPSFVGQYTHVFDAPVSAEEGLAHLHRYVNTFRVARLHFDIGTTLYFDRNGFKSFTGTS